MGLTILQTKVLCKLGLVPVVDEPTRWRASGPEVIAATFTIQELLTKLKPLAKSDVIGFRMRGNGGVWQLGDQSNFLELDGQRTSELFRALRDKQLYEALAFRGFLEGFRIKERPTLRDGKDAAYVDQYVITLMY